MEQTGGPHIPVDRIFCVHVRRYGELSWDCRLPPDVPARIVEHEIACEGFSHPSDTAIVAGSCAIRYTLAATETPPAFDRPETQYMAWMLFPLGIVAVVAYLAWPYRPTVLFADGMRME